jgi:hypothetical protein
MPRLRLAALPALAFLAVLAPSAAAVPAANQPKCATGAIKAIVGMTASDAVGFQKAYTTAASMFGAKWTCKKATIEARRVDRGVYDVRVGGGLTGTPIVTVIGAPAKVGTTRLADGGVEIRLLATVNGAETEVDEAFVVIFV